VVFGAPRRALVCVSSLSSRLPTPPVPCALFSLPSSSALDTALTLQRNISGEGFFRVQSPPARVEAC